VTEDFIVLRSASFCVGIRCQETTNEEEEEEEEES
jgi:hypothetical protein